MEREPAIGDPFGDAILSHLEHGDDGLHVVERDDGYLHVLGSRPYFAPIEEWNPGEAALIDKASGRVLDVGAGAGRVSLHLQEQGFDVTALDVSPGAIEVCRRRGVEQRFAGTMEDLAAGGVERFDTFVLFGALLGLIGSPDAAPGFFGTIRSLAAPGALLIGTTRDPYVTEDPIHFAYHDWNRRRGRPAGQVTHRIRRRNVATPWSDLLWVSFEELRAITGPLGWIARERSTNGPHETVVLQMT